MPSTDEQLTTFVDLTTPDMSQSFYFCNEDDRIVTTLELDMVEGFQVMSRNYPENYPNNLCQEWVLSSPVGTKIKFEFLQFDASICTAYAYS